MVSPLYREAFTHLSQLRSFHISNSVPLLKGSMFTFAISLEYFPVMLAQRLAGGKNGIWTLYANIPCRTSMDDFSKYEILVNFCNNKRLNPISAKHPYLVSWFHITQLLLLSFSRDDPVIPNQCSLSPTAPSMRAARFCQNRQVVYRTAHSNRLCSAEPHESIHRHRILPARRLIQDILASLTSCSVQ